MTKCLFSEYIESEGIPYKSYNQLLSKCKCDECMKEKKAHNRLIAEGKKLMSDRITRLWGQAALEADKK